MHIVPAICDFCSTGKMVVKLPKAGGYLICRKCVADLATQFDLMLENKGQMPARMKDNE